jgi:putative transposase
MSATIDAQLTVDALVMAYARQKPAPGLIVHSDRGSQPGLNRSSQHGLVVSILAPH